MIVIRIIGQIKTEDFNKFDLILGFDNDNIRNLERIKPKSSKAVVRLVNYYNPNNKNAIIPDPWYIDTDAAFEKVYNDCLQCCQTLLNSDRFPE